MKLPKQMMKRFLRYVLKKNANVEQGTEAPQQQPPQRSTDEAEPESAAGPSDLAQKTQQRIVEQVFDVPDEESQQLSERGQRRSDEQVVDVNLDRAPLAVTQRVPAKATPEGSIARAVRLELERVRFEKEARRKFFRSPHCLDDQRGWIAQLY